MSELLIRGKPMTDTETVSKRIPFNLFYIREMEAYLSEMSSNGLQLSKETENKLIFEKTEPQEMSYRLLLGNLETDETLAETLRASGWEFICSIKRKTMITTKVFHIFANANTVRNDSIFHENNRKYAVSLVTTRKFAVEALLYLPLMCFVVYISWRFFQSNRMQLISFALAGTIRNLIDLFAVYKAQRDFVKTYQNERDSIRSDIPNWRKAKADADRLVKIDYICMFVIVVIIYFILSALFRNL